MIPGYFPVVDPIYFRLYLCPKFTDLPIISSVSIVLLLPTRQLLFRIPQISAPVRRWEIRFGDLQSPFNVSQPLRVVLDRD